MTERKRSSNRVKESRQRQAKRRVRSTSRSLSGERKRNTARSRREKRATGDATQNMPPVMARGCQDTLPVNKGRRTNPWRRYDVALSVPGAEIRLPAIPTLRLGWRMVSAVLSLMMLFCLFNLWNSEAFRVQMVEINGLQRLTPADINTVLGIIGKSIFFVDSHRMEQDLQQVFPELSEIAVQIGLPAQVLVTVVERQPVLSWIQEGHEMWVDLDGAAFPPRGNPGELVRVEAKSAPPLVDAGIPVPDSAYDTAILLPPEFVATLLTLGAEVPQDTLLLYDREHGFGWRDSRGWQAYFGLGTQDISMRLLVYQALVKRLEADGVHPTFISVEYIHAPYYRTEH